MWRRGVSREVLLPLLRKWRRGHLQRTMGYMCITGVTGEMGTRKMGHVHHRTIVTLWHQVHLTLLSAQFNEGAESLTPVCTYTHGIMILRTRIHTYTHTNTTHVYTYTHMYPHTHTYTHHIRTHTYTCIHTYTHTPHMYTRQSFYLWCET